VARLIQVNIEFAYASACGFLDLLLLVIRQLDRQFVSCHDVVSLTRVGLFKSTLIRILRFVSEPVNLGSGSLSP
jgi:hypothetical protein